MSRCLKPRLSLLFFLQYFINGAIFPIIALYLKDYLHFTGVQAGTILATAAISAIVSPVFGAVVADKFLSAEKLFGLCSLLSALCMFTLSRVTGFIPVLIFYFFFGLFNGPAVALSNAIVFHHTPGDREKFGGMRLWGTVGWITVAMGFSLIYLRSGGNLRGALVLAGIAGIFLAAYVVLAIPGGEKRAAGRPTMFPREALRVFARRDILLLSVVTLLFVTGEKIYYFGTGLYLRSLGLEETFIMPFMSIAQGTEIIAMLLLARIIRRWSARRVLFFGLAFQGLKFLLLSSGPLALAGAGIACHGPSFTLFMITAFIYLDRHCGKEIRTGVHQIFNFVEAGLANLLGNVGAGLLSDAFALPSGGMRFRLFWAVPGATVMLLLLLMICFFPTEQAHLKRRGRAPDP